MAKTPSIRTRELIEYDNAIRGEGKGLLCGLDEAGRGPIAGPVVAAAVIFGDDVYIEGVFDSKKVTKKMRENLYEEIITHALSWGIGIIDNRQIDEVMPARFGQAESTVHEVLPTHHAVKREPLGQVPDLFHDIVAVLSGLRRIKASAKPRR